MALVKTNKITNGKLASARAHVAAPAPATGGAPRKRPRNGVGNHTLSERLAAATEELASGLAEASSAATELRSSMEQIASGAEEAAGASQEQLGAIKRIFDALRVARSEADGARRRTDSVQAILTDTAAQITASARAIMRNAQRQESSIEIIAELERRAKDIGEITLTVSRVSDQTNLLALNAAIEAARAGDDGRGFAVVADEIRALAENSDKNAQDVKLLAEEIQGETQSVVASVRVSAQASSSEARAATSIVAALEARREDMQRIALASEEVAAAAVDAERAALEAQSGAEQVATAAEEQSAGAAEAQTAVEQQAKSLEQGQIAARGLAALAEGLRTGKSAEKTAEQIGAAAEELSASIQELTSAASQIMAAVEQINRGSQQQAAATHETSAALSQIEKSAKQTQKNTGEASERVKKLESALNESRVTVEKLMSGVDGALKETRSNVATITKLETVGQRIEKIVDAIALIAVQTSMLAVSGAVEAARAGDAGRGFAVVSNDIRGLAREAANNVDRAKDTVRGILEQIAALKRELERAIAAAEIEIQNNQSVFSALDKLDGELAALSVSNAAIFEGAQSILGSVTETAAGARQIAAAAEEAGGASRQAATASAEQARGAEDLAAAIEEIASLAEALKLDNG